jgi:hypothetical protein
MQQIIVDLVVAAAILFLLSWLIRSFVSKRQEKPACGSCPQCATAGKPVPRTEPSVIHSKG